MRINEGVPATVNRQPITIETFLSPICLPLHAHADHLLSLPLPGGVRRAGPDALPDHEQPERYPGPDDS